MLISTHEDKIPILDHVVRVIVNIYFEHLGFYMLWVNYPRWWKQQSIVPALLPFLRTKINFILLNSDIIRVYQEIISNCSTYICKANSTCSRFQVACLVIITSSNHYLLLYKTQVGIKSRFADATPLGVFWDRFFYKWSVLIPRELCAAKVFKSFKI